MTEFLLFLMLFTAVAGGWCLGYWSRRRRRKRDRTSGEAATEGSTNYYQGLNFLLNEQPDSAIDAFVNSLEVNADTLETHLAVGALLRRRGEVDRAIRVHQNLLARPSLPVRHLNQVHLELARDYISAGLLDRAERLLQDLLTQAPPMRATAMRHLLEIYQDEKEWEKAIAVASELVPRRPWLRTTVPQNSAVTRAIAHFYCELAEKSRAGRDLPLARSSLRHALNYDRNCVRASLLLTQLENEQGNARQALRALRRIEQQNPVYLCETVELLREVYQQRGEHVEYVRHLTTWYRECPGTSVLLALVEAMRESGDDEQAEAYLAEQMKIRPTLRGLARLLDFHGQRGDNQDDSVLALQRLVDELLAEKPVYQCGHCGFSGRKLHWQCPSCKEWGSIAPIRGPEGD